MDTLRRESVNRVPNLFPKGGLRPCREPAFVADWSSI